MVQVCTHEGEHALEHAAGWAAFDPVRDEYAYVHGKKILVHFDARRALLRDELPEPSAKYRASAAHHEVHRTL